MAQHPNQQGLLPLPPPEAALAPRGRGAGNNRRRQPRNNQRRDDAGEQPRRRNNLPLPTGAPPRPQFLATTSTPERNDPLWTTGVAGDELQPMPNIEYVFSSAEVLPQLCSVVHQANVAASAAYSRRVPESAFNYYAAVLTYARMLSLHKANGLLLSLDEDRFCEQVSSLQLEAPVLLAHFLSGFGNTRVPSGRDVRFRMLDRPDYGDYDGIPGWFGQVSSETQPLYQNYPCLAVYAARMMSSLGLANAAANLWWIPPLEVRPGLAGEMRPSSAMLGYGPRERLSPGQSALLEGAGIMVGEYFPTSNPSLPLCFPLLLAIHNELKTIGGKKMLPLPTAILGSQAQLGRVTVELELNNRAVDRTHIFESPYRMPREITVPATAFCYRVLHAVENFNGTQFAPWCVWLYNNVHGVDWADVVTTGNALRETEPEFLGLSEFRVAPYLVRARLEALESGLNRA